MVSYRRAVWVPEINEIFFLFLSCNECKYFLRDYSGDNTQEDYPKLYSGCTSDLPQEIKKIRPPIDIPLEDPNADESWRNYLFKKSEILEKDQTQEPIEEKLIEIISRKNRYDTILDTLLKHKKAGQCIYESVIVDYPKDCFPANCKGICNSGKSSLFVEGKQKPVKKKSDICGIVNGEVRIIIEEESEQGKSRGDIDKIVKCKYMKLRGDKRIELKKVILFIVENGAATRQDPSTTEAFSHIIICNNENFSDEYGKIKRYI